MIDTLTDAFFRALAASGYPALIPTGEENYAHLAESGGKKIIVAKSRLPNFFATGFNPMDPIQLQTLRHRLDTAIEQMKKPRAAGRHAILLCDAWDSNMKVEEIKAAVDSVYAAGVPLECDGIWAAESKVNPPRFTNVTPNRPRSMPIPLKPADAASGHHTGHEHHSSEGECCGG